ncbi:MAG: leucyl aminopeptidase [Solirubrobacterales bacterium]
MELEVVSAGLEELDTDLVALAFAEGDELPEAIRDAPGAAAARPGFKKLALLYPERPARVLVAGAGDPEDVDLERLRVLAALVAKRAGALEAKSLAWALGDDPDAPERAAALVEGTTLAGYRFDRYRSRDDDAPPPSLERLVLATGTEQRDAIASEAAVAMVVAGAANRARELQDLPANVLTPEALAARAQEIAAAHERVEVEVLDRNAIAALEMGGLIAVSAGSAAEPRLIALRYTGGGGSRIGLVGKAVTFDSGGISIKPSAGMHEMKMDMSGGGAVLEAIAAIAELGLDLDLVAAIPATENMLSGSAVKPGDIITQLNGKTVEVNNTDAEGRLILADALSYCVRELRAERVVDVATLTGAVVIALGSTYAALISNDDDWAEAVRAAAEHSGELAWRLPLHPEYKELTKGTVADLTNAAAKRKAGTIYAGSFLEEFVDEVPWAHLDIAGTAWDTGREYVGKGASGFGVRLLVRLARDLAGPAA